MLKSIPKHGKFIIKTSLFMILLFGVQSARAEYWIDEPPIAPVGCGYVVAYGFSSGCHRHRVYHKYKRHYVKKYYHRYPRVNYRVEEYFYVPPVCTTCAPPPPPPVRCGGCSACGSCGSGGVEWMRGDDSYYSDPTMGGYPRYPYVSFRYDPDMRTGDDYTEEVSYTY